MKTRKIWSKIEKYIDKEYTIVLTGPRRVGKTTTLKWILEKIESKNKIYIDLENISNREIFENKNYDSIKNLFESRGLNMKEKIYIALDEIQYVKNTPSIVKYLQDNYNFKFFLSGSSSYYIKNLFSESLAGRKIIFEILPLAFDEYISFKELDYKLNTFNYTDSPKYNSVLSKELEYQYLQYIQFGGLPQIALLDSEDRKKEILEDTYSSYINLDVKTLADFKSLREFRKIVNLIAVRVGSKINTSEIAEISGISRITVETYLEFMSKTYLVRKVQAYSKSVDIREKKQDKIYFIDNGILNINADISLGSKLENSISQQLGYIKDITYYSNNKSELDFIVDKQYGLEIKETPTLQDFNKVKKLEKKLKLKTINIVGRNQNPKFNEYIWAGEISS